MRPLEVIAFIVAAPLALAACAVNRSVVDVGPFPTPPLAVPTASAVPAVEAPFARVGTVRDLRRFVRVPADPSQPSLRYDSDLENPAVLARAVGRKRNLFDAEMGDVLLPQGVTVADVVATAARRALERRGYVVVEDDDVPALDIDVLQFWAWSTSGLTSTRIDFALRLALRGDDLLGGGATVDSRSSTGDFAAFDGTWRAVMERGIDEAIMRMAGILRPPAPPAPPPSPPSPQTVSRPDTVEPPPLPADDRLVRPPRDLPPRPLAPVLPRSFDPDSPSAEPRTTAPVP